MPQMTALVLTDGENNHSYAPRGIDANGVATLVESTGIPLGDRRLTVQRTRTQQGREKVSFKMTLPVVQNGVQNGITAPTIVRTAYADVQLSFDAGSNTEEREDAINLLVSALGHADLKKISVNLESLY